MRVSTHCNSPVEQRQQTSCHDHGFADMFASMSAHRHGSFGHGKAPHQHSHATHTHGKPEPQKDCCCQPNRIDIAYLNLRVMSFHKCGATQIKLTPEQLRPLHQGKTPCGCAQSAPKPEHHKHVHKERLVIGVLQGYHEDCKAELVQRVPNPPTYPKSILNMSASELQVALSAVSIAVYGIQVEGVPRQEVYDEVKKIYESYLGADFLEHAHTKQFDYSDSKHNLYSSIYAQFFSELNSHQVHSLTTKEVRTLEKLDVAALDALTEKLLAEKASPKNPRSIYDMPYPDAWAALDAVSIQARTGGNIGDAEGLTREEIFDRLWKVYASYFGKDFLDGGVATRGEGGLYDEIYLQFFDELKQYNVHATSTDAILSLRSYSVQALDASYPAHCHCDSHKC